MGWHPNEWLTITGGKFANPFYTTELLWDSDINPTGVAEVIAFHHLIDDADGTGGTAKDGKTSKAMIATERPWTLSLVAGQFIFQDNNESNGPDGDSSTDAYLFQTQLIGSYKFGRTKVTLAPGWLTYINGSLNGIDNGTSYNDAFIGQGGTRALNLLLAPGDVSLKLAGVKTKFYWDFSYNFDGEKRVQGIYGLANKAGNPQHRTKDDFAWLAGVQIGENHMAGDWSLMANWRQTGLGAVDPNLNDSDYALGQLNTRGAKFVGSYNLTDFTVFSLTYDYAWNLRNTLFGGQTTGGNAVANSNVVNTLLVEFLLKF